LGRARRRFVSWYIVDKILAGALALADIAAIVAVGCAAWLLFKALE
jgi:hypothetical protein